MLPVYWLVMVTNCLTTEFSLGGHTLAVGDQILITGPTTGVIEVVLPEMQVNDQSKETAQKGDIITFKLETKIRESDKLYKIVDAKRTADQHNTEKKE